MRLPRANASVGQHLHDALRLPQDRGLAKVTLAVGFDVFRVEAVAVDQPALGVLCHVGKPAERTVCRCCWRAKDIPADRAASGETNGSAYTGTTDESAYPGTDNAADACRLITLRSYVFVGQPLGPTPAVLIVERAEQLPRHPDRPVDRLATIEETLRDLLRLLLVVWWLGQREARIIRAAGRRVERCQQILSITKQSRSSGQTRPALRSPADLAAGDLPENIIDGANVIFGERLKQGLQKGFYLLEGTGDHAVHALACQPTGEGVSNAFLDPLVFRVALFDRIGDPFFLRFARQGSPFTVGE